MQQKTRVISNGDGTWERAWRTDVPDTPHDGTQGAQGAFVNPSAPPTASTDEHDPFAGKPTHLDAKNIPAGLADAFNKKLEHTIGTITYRYRESSWMELLSLGTNPFLMETLQAGELNPLDDDFMSKLSAMPEDELELLNAQSKLHRDKVLLHFLTEIQGGEDRVSVDAGIIAAMREDTKNELYTVITGEGTAELEAVRQFPDGGGQDSGDNDIPSG